MRILVINNIGKGTALIECMQIKTDIFHLCGKDGEETRKGFLRGLRNLSCLNRLWAE
jgi:hypothetical protein